MFQINCFAPFYYRSKLFCGNVPDRKKLKWRKSTSDAIRHDSGTHRNENTILTSSHYRSVPIASNGN